MSGRNAGSAQMAVHEPGEAHRGCRRAGVGNFHLTPLETHVRQCCSNGGHAQRGVGRCARFLVLVESDTQHVDGPEVVQFQAHEAGTEKRSSNISSPSTSTHSPCMRIPIELASTSSTRVARMRGPSSRRTSAMVNGTAMSTPE